jgi:hypothetical protein
MNEKIEQKKGSANVQRFYEASFMPGRLIVNKIKGAPVHAGGFFLCPCTDLVRNVFVRPRLVQAETESREERDSPG